MLAETKTIDLDDDIDSGSEYDGCESNLKKMVGAGPRHVHRVIKEQINSSVACDESIIHHHESVSEFGDSYGTIAFCKQKNLKPCIEVDRLDFLIRFYLTENLRIA